MKNLTLIISVLIPVFSFLSTTLMIYADRHTVSVDPLSVIHRATAILTTKDYNPSKAASDKMMELHNRKMRRIWFLGIICLIVSFALSLLLVIFTAELIIF